MKYFILALILNSYISFGSSQPAEVRLENYLDSAIEVNDIEYNVLEEELLHYSRLNYKKLNSVEDIINYSISKLTDRTKNYSNEFLEYFKHLKLLSYYSGAIIKDFEDNNAEIIEADKLWTEIKLPTRLYIFLHEINYWGLNVYKPVKLATRLRELYLSTKNKSLVNKIVILILVDKIYNSNSYVDRTNVSESRHLKIKLQPTANQKINIDSGYAMHVTGPDIQLPNFPGGEDLMIKFVMDNFVYPRKAKEQQIEGVVNLSFTINEKGLVKKIEVLNSRHVLLSREAVRIMKSMPKWRPGSKKGKPIAYRLTLPIHFHLQKKKEVTKAPTYWITNGSIVGK